MPTPEKPKKPVRRKRKPAAAPAPKPEKPEKTKKGRPTTFYLKWIVIMVGIIIAAGIILYAIYHATKFKALAEYKGGKVTRDDFVKVLRIETGKYDPLVWKDEQQSLNKKKEILNEVIKEHILLDMAKKQNVTVSDEELKADLESYKSGYTENTFVKMLESKGINYNDWVERKRDKYIVQKLIKKEVIDKINIDPTDIKKYYNQHIDKFTHTEQVRARHILVSSWEEAEKIEDQLKKGGNFAAIAKKKSISPDRWKGGDLGYFSHGTHPEIFDRICFYTPVGKTSQIIRSDYGYHIFKVIDKRGPAKESLKDAEKYIITSLQQQHSKESFEKWFKPIYDSAAIKINYDLLKQIEVVPHGDTGE